MDAQEILVEHLREALRQLQRYLAAGLATALSLVLLALAPAGHNAPITVPVISIAASPYLVKALLLAVYIGSGFLCYSTVLDARKIAARITDKDIRSAAVSFPTVASSADHGLRRLGTIAPALIFAFFLAIDFYFAEARPFQKYLLFVLFGIMPYVGVAYEVSQPLDAGVQDDSKKRDYVFLPAGQGRSYPMGRISALFKADGDETKKAYSISEWWLEPNTQGPGAHCHAEDDVFYVIEGTMSVLVEDRWIDAPEGSFVLAPGGVTHDFENRSSRRAGVLNFSIPGDFEKNMPAIAKWFVENPPKDA